MSYTVRTLSKGEEIKVVAKLHWMNYAIAAFLFLVAIICSVFCFRLYQASSYNNLMAFICGFAAVSVFFGALVSLLSLFTREMVVTNKRVVSRWGVVSVRTDELKINRIESVEINQSVLGRILGYGTILFSGTGTSKARFSNVEKPWEMKSMIDSETN